jgi:lysophospholipase L1-like esterase
MSIFQENDRILFQGDSITDGNRARNADPNHILGHGYCFIIAAKYGHSLAERKLSFMNRGISGDTVIELESRWQSDTLDLKPTVLSILIGINDSGRKIPLNDFERIYDNLIRDAKTANPALRLVLCEPFLLLIDGAKAGNSEPGDVRLRQVIVEKLALKYDATLVKLQAALDNACKRAPSHYWVWDGVHPTYAGHQVIADEWTKTVAQNQ